jgi:hypothetical protein
MVMRGMISEISNPVIVDFPLRGEWWATSTPAERVPSHGTNFFAQRYAFDFVRMDPTGTWYYPGEFHALLRHLSTGLQADRFFCWDEPVHSVSDGRVLFAEDGWPDRARVRFFWELLRPTFTPPRVRQGGDYRPLAGNYVIVEGPEGVAIYGHLRAGSVRVAAGERVDAGAILGAVGNSGNSTMPHLHFHLMDGPDPMTARGIPCAFRCYERWKDDQWETVRSGVPGPMERLRIPR